MHAPRQLPEDHVAPLPIICMMYEVLGGEQGPQAAPSVLNIRRWTKILIDKSLWCVSSHRIHCCHAVD